MPSEYAVMVVLCPLSFIWSEIELFLERDTCLDFINDKLIIYPPDRDGEEGGCENVLLEMRLATIANMMKNAERIGEREHGSGSVELFLTDRSQVCNCNANAFVYNDNDSQN